MRNNNAPWLMAMTCIGTLVFFLTELPLVPAPMPTTTSQKLGAELWHMAETAEKGFIMNEKPQKICFIMMSLLSYIGTLNPIWPMPCD